MSEAAQAMPTTVPDLLDWIERQFEIGEPTSTHLAVTGEPYFIIGNTLAPSDQPGVVAEGAQREAAFDEETACMSAASAFREYAEGKTGKLYWRWKPELLWDSPMGRRCIVYMRLLISDKPTKES